LEFDHNAGFICAGSSKVIVKEGMIARELEN
jgi:hypothetical protein